MTITVVIPSRGRPARAREAIDAIRQTAVLVSTEVILVVDEDDPELAGYFGVTRAAQFGDFAPQVALVTLRAEQTGNLVRATNTVSMRVARADPDAIIGNLGDDHLCRTPGWDRAIAEALQFPGVAYGNDLIQGETLPTAPFISASIVLALGYYALPDLEHMYIDNVWRDVAEQSGVRRYLPEVVIEHMHPAVSKAAWDTGYIRVNSNEAIERDRRRYESWRQHAMATDVGRVRAMLEAVAA